MKLSKTQKALLQKAKKPNGEYQLFFSADEHYWLAETHDKFRLTTLVALIGKGAIERIRPENEPFWRGTYQITAEAKVALDVSPVTQREVNDG